MLLPVYTLAQLSSAGLPLYYDVATQPKLCIAAQEVRESVIDICTSFS
jgi:hypothetical protein